MAFKKWLHKAVVEMSSKIKVESKKSSGLWYAGRHSFAFYSFEDLSGDLIGCFLEFAAILNAFPSSGFLFKSYLVVTHTSTISTQ